MQPIKEQRDALDHIARAYDSALQGIEDTTELSKALGHINRAFYDVADILTIVLRDNISAYLSEFSYKEILDVWPEYADNRKFLVKVGMSIAKLRHQKGRTKNDNVIGDYKNIVNKLHKIHEIVVETVYPKLCIKYR